MKLYELEAQYRDALDRLPIDPETGEILNEESLAALDALQGDLKEKLCSVAAFSKELVAEADAIKTAYASMQTREKALRNRADWLKRYARETMVRTGVQKAETPFCRVSVGKPMMKVEITDLAKVPYDFLKPVEIKADLAKIKAALKAGETVAGASLVPGEPVLRIA
jgi:hypothetical protein